MILAAVSTSVQDAVRLYEQGWTVRQVAEKFDCSHGAMSRVLGRHITLRNRGGNAALESSANDL